MGSTGNQNPWTPFNGNKDCSLGICSIHCPQFCYFIFPPPPPSYVGDSSSPFSPLIIAIIGLLASAFLLVSYYTIVTKYCRRGPQNAPAEAEENHEDIVHDQWQAASSGLDEATIKTITVCKYQKDQGLIEGTECAVCLSEFQENESLRLLPKCSHAFHLPCIDTWLKSHSNCPLCRANVTALPPPQASSAVHVDSYEVERPNDLTLVVDDQETLDCMVVITLNDDDDQGILKRDSGNADETERRHDQACLVKQFRRSSSLGAFTSGHHLLISDHASKIEELDVDSQVEKHESWRDTASSSKGFPVSGDRLEKSNCMPIKRYNSTGRFMFIDHNKGKNSLLPH